MVALLSLIIRILAPVVLSEMINVAGHAVPHFTKSKINPTKKTPDSSDRVKQSVEISSSRATCSGDARTFSNCLHGIQRCLSLCCPLGKTLPEGSCLEDNSSPAILSDLVTFINHKYVQEGDIMSEEKEPYRVLNRDPCDISWMTSTMMKNFSVLKNGSVYVPDFDGGSPLDFEHYCLIRDPESSGYLAKVCRPWISKSYYIISCVIIATVIMLTIFIAYTIVPELRNLHGLIFRSYVVAYIGTYVSVLGLMFTTELRVNTIWFSFSEIGIRYFCISCVIWLNVMSFDIWRSFRGLRQIRYNSAEEDRKTFIWYAIYAWIGPIILTVVVAGIIISLPQYRIDKIDTNLKQWVGVGVITTVYLCNTFLYTSTALNIRRQKKETAYLVHFMHKHYEVNQQWFSLYLKLFVIMGGHVITWPLLLGWATPLTMSSLATLEVLQGILIFVIFIWKVNVKRSLLKQFQSSRMVRIIIGTLSVTRHA